MGSTTYTVAFQGIDVLTVSVEVQITGGPVAIPIVGLPDKAVAESRERIRGALQAIGLGIPGRRIIVNLSPALVQKEGTHYDLPIALGLLEVMDVLPKGQLENYYVMGELGLNGSIQPVPGILPAAMTAFQEGKSLICPYDSAQEATWVEGLNVVAVPTLLSLLNFLSGKQVLTPPSPRLLHPPAQKKLDWQDVKGQILPKRALEIAAAGGHNILMAGPPGAGKSMLAERFSTILPPLTPKEALEISMIYSIAGLLNEGHIFHERPFRSPHHSASLPALIGGGVRAKPGEVTLAHRGVLFLDELPEFARNTLESLRQPLESKKAVVARANGHYTYPANFQLIAAMNPCPCGYLSDPARSCSRAPQCSEKYLEKLSGPFLDRIDLYVTVEAPSAFALDSSSESEESSSTVLRRILKAREIQHQRHQEVQGLNNDISVSDLERLCDPTSESKELLKKAFEKFGLSLRACHRTLRVARSIADLDGAKQIEKPHMHEALSLRGRI